MDFKALLKRNYREIRNRLRPAVLVYRSEGWSGITEQDQGWSNSSVTGEEQSKWTDFNTKIKSTGPLGISHEQSMPLETRNLQFHNVNMTYAYVLSLAAFGKKDVSVLDVGGGLGHYFQLGQELYPELNLSFDVLEVPEMVKKGRQVNPQVRWLDQLPQEERRYDLVMINGSMQYMPNWKSDLKRFAASSRKYLFLTRLPVVENHPGYVATQHIYGTQMYHQQLNVSEVLNEAEKVGMRLVREVVVGDFPWIRGAPEPCELRGWLFSVV